MPIYEYTCRDCGEETERLQKLSEPDWLDCPACGKSALVRTVSAAGFRLSGSGWYETDFKKDGKRNLAGGAEGTPAKSNAEKKSDKSEGSGKNVKAPEPQKANNKGDAKK